MSGEKSNNPLSPDYVPSLFTHTTSPVKRKLAGNAARFERDQKCKKRRLENESRFSAAHSLLELSDYGYGSLYCEPQQCSTDLTMQGIHQLEKDVVQLEGNSNS